MHVTVSHSHDPDLSAAEALKLKMKMRDDVRNIRARPGQVLAAGIASTSDDVRLNLGRTESLRRNLRRLVYGHFRMHFIFCFVSILQIPFPPFFFVFIYFRFPYTVTFDLTLSQSRRPASRVSIIMKDFPITFTCLKLCRQ